MASLFTDFLSALGIRHTEAYSDSRFRNMPFRSLFSLAALLGEYGVATAGNKVAEGCRAGALWQLPVPFLADTPRGFIIVTDVTSDGVSYLSQSHSFTAPAEKILDGWNGIALLAEAGPDACEPEYRRHRIAEIAALAKRWILLAAAAMLLALAMWQTGPYGSPGAWALLALDSLGLWLSLQLVQKSLGIKTRVGEAVCSVLEEGGCDEIARSEASSFLGIVKWSEVGLSYFGVSLAALLIFPASTPTLALINILCLPYTVWSICYQRFVAKTWCTLCVCVQATLWLLCAAYFLGGFTRSAFPLTWSTGFDMAVAALCYLVALLGINRIDDFLLKFIKTTGNENSQNS